MKRRLPVINQNEISFRYSRSGGPGGQHSNKVNTRVELIWNISESASISEANKKLLLSRLGPRVRIVVSQYRSQRRNKDLALERLMSVVEKNLRTDPKRIASKPSASAKRKRIEQKKKRGELKRQRNSANYLD
ncbi:MAG: aminoacyl-tRNA hydrolase [Acidimicrobiaceae bacterium]|nr:aminoacyl-tRNA hydrolase [Acidimicrobiaceae bacterium]